MRQSAKQAILVLALAGILPCVQAWAGEIDECGDEKTFAGKPISLLSGAETFNRADLTLGNIYPITIQRQYNSRTAYDSQLGYGWALNYDKRLYTYPDGSVTVRKDCGAKRRFTWSIAGYITPPGETGTLVQNADGTYTYTTGADDKESYDERGRLSGLVDSRGNSLVFTYSSLVRDALWGLLPFNINQSSPLIVAYDYRLVRIEEKDASGSLTGNWVSFQYDYTTGRLNQITDSTGRTVAYTHDPIGNLTDVTGPNGTAAYGYTNTTYKHHLTSISEGQGEYVNTYDDKGRVTRQTHAGGIIDIEYLEPHKKTKVTTTITGGANGPLTQTRIVEFDTQGQMVRNTDTDGHVTVYVRNSSTWITREEYYENTGIPSAPALVLRRAMDFTYDTKGNMLTRIDTGYAADGTTIQSQTTTTWTYHPVFNKVETETMASVVNPAQNKITTNSYNPTTGNLETVTETGLLGNGSPYTYVTTYTYYPNGKLWTVDGPRTDVSDVTTYEYTSNGYIWKVTQPIIGTTTYSNHDSLGNPRTVTDPNGNSMEYTYDAIGRVLTVKALGDTNPTQYFYVSAGCTSCGGGGANKIDHITLPEGNTIWYTYDTFGNLIAIKDGMNNSINYTYDSEGNRLTEQIKDSAGTLQKSLSYQYDALNRLKQIKNPDASYTEYGYDFRGNQKSMKDPKGNTTTYNYDALNRLIAVIQPGNISTSYEYNSRDNLTKVIDANTNATVYKYDDAGRVFQVISPDTGTTTYSYDAAGNLTSKTDAKGVTIAYQYDALNRLTKIDFSQDADIIYAYDNCPNGKGRLCTITDQSGTTSYEWWSKGQVKKETKVIDGVTYVTQYSYDQNGNIKTMTYPSGKIITYNYSNDRAVSVLNGAANLATNINYRPFGGMTSITYGNGIAGSINYDNQYRISAMTAGTVLNLGYNGYDSNGNITAITNNLDPTKNKSFTYDALDRLSTATASGIWGSLGWTYDGVGNRQTENGNTYTYFIGSNKLSTANGLSYGYDNNGNTTTEGSRQYIYNQNQRLIQVNNGATTAYYTYNGNGQRVKKDVNGVVTIFLYGLSGQIIAESNSAGTISAEYVYLNGQSLAKIDSSGVNYIHTDHLGTPMVMADNTGVKIWEIEARPFGDGAIITGSATLNLRFSGQYHDSETGNNQNWYRDYAPPLARYIESDPLLLMFIQQTQRKSYFIPPYYITTPNKLHGYVYVGNNPEILTDPLGLFHRGPVPTEPRWNGNLWHRYRRQDMECSPPAQLFNNNPGTRACCEEHDRCYARYQCNFSSWATLCMNSPCQQCNLQVAGCILRNLPTHIPDDLLN